MARPWIALCAALALAGCGGSEGGLDGDAADELHRGVDAVRAAAADKDRDAALKALDALDDRVAKQKATGALAASAASDLRRGIARAKRRARRELAAPEPTAEAVGTREPAAEPTTEAALPSATTEPEPKVEEDKPQPEPTPEADGGGDQGSFDDDGEGED